MTDLKMPQELGDVSDVTHSTAYLSVDSLMEEGKLVAERAEHLKSKFKDLHDRVLQIYNHDNFLLKRARQTRKVLETEKSKVDQRGQIAREDDDQIQQLKKELAAAEHELSVAQEKESMLQVEALELDRKRQNLTHEVQDAIAAEEARAKPQIDALSKDIGTIGANTDAVVREFEDLKEARELLLKKESDLKGELTQTDFKLAEAKTEFTRVEREPERAKKQADIVQKAFLTAEQELKVLDERLGMQKNLIDKLTTNKGELNTKVLEFRTVVRKNIEMTKDKENTLISLQENLKLEEEGRQHCVQRLSELERLLKAAAVAFNSERDAIAKTSQAKEAAIRENKRIDQEKSDLEHEREMFKKQFETLNRESHQIEVSRKQRAKELEELKRDVDILINNFLTVEIAENRCVRDREATQEAIRALEDQVVTRSQQEILHKAEIAEMAMRREQVSRDCSKNQARVQLAKNEVKVKEVILRELRKRNEELTTKLSTLMEMFQTVKRERSQKAAQIQSASQRMSEMQEKIKILDNELEVLRRESAVKDQELTKKRRERHELQQTCDNLRVEINKAQSRLSQAENSELDLKNRMRKLNTVITKTEDDMLDLKKNYEDAVENRNYAGVRLIDRNDELCILYEKANVQESILKQGMTMLNQRSEEIRALTAKLTDLQRQIELCQKVLPEVRDMEEQLASVLLELDDERLRAEVLEDDITDPSNTSRWRKVGRAPLAQDDPTTEASAASQGPSSEFVALQKQCQDLEQRVATVTEKLMEKDLLLEEVTDMSNKLRKRALNGRDFTLALAKRVGNYQAGIKAKTKKMMATLSELSMVQASSLQLQMEVQQLESTVTEARDRVERGEAPTDYHQYQFDKEEVDRKRRDEMMRSRKERMATSLVDYRSPTNTLESAIATQPIFRTTAEQRPNAYVPDDDLALPKPYGAHAPFKPNLAAQQNVHKYFRKPQQRDLDEDM